MLGGTPERTRAKGRRTGRSQMTMTNQILNWETVKNVASSRKRKDTGEKVTENTAEESSNTGRRRGKGLRQPPNLRV